MTTNFTIVFQIIMAFLQAIVGFNITALPVKWQGIAASVVGTATLIQAILAHGFTPAGNKIDSTTGAVKSTDGVTTVAHVPTIQV